MKVIDAGETLTFGEKIRGGEGFQVTRPKKGMLHSPGCNGGGVVR